jgi:hypothetical protein
VSGEEEEGGDEEDDHFLGDRRGHSRGHKLRSVRGAQRETRDVDVYVLVFKCLAFRSWLCIIANSANTADM